MTYGTTSATPGQLSEINSAFCRAMPKAIAPFDPKEIIAGVQKNGEQLEQYMQRMLTAFLAKCGEKSATTSPIAFKHDMRKEEGWTHFESEEVGFIPEINFNSLGRLELVPFLKKGEKDIGGEELVARARGELKANLGQRHVEYLLDNQHLIPEKFKGYFLVFPGTIWQRRDDHLRVVPCLGWEGSYEWCLNFRWLEGRYHSRSRLVRLGK